MNKVIGQEDYVWRATMDDGSVIEQFSTPNLTSFAAVDATHCKELSIIPRTRTRGRNLTKDLPTVRVVPQLALGETAFWHWLVDEDMISHDKLYRHVIGIQQADSKMIYAVTVSANGDVTICTNEDLAPVPSLW